MNLFRKIFSPVGRNISALAAKWGMKSPRTRVAKVGYFLLLELLVLIPEILLSLPFIIASIAWHLNHTGVAAGDADGMSGSFGVLYFLVALFTLLSVLLIQWWIVEVIRKGRQS